MSEITEETVNQILSCLKRKSTLKEKDAEEKINKVWSYIGKLKSEIFSLEEKIDQLDDISKDSIYINTEKLIRLYQV